MTRVIGAANKLRSGLLVATMGVLLAALALLTAPTAPAATHTFLKTDGFGPANQESGPANVYPSTISVSGLEGTVTEVRVQMLEMVATADLDMALVGPNGQAVMLLSDACGSEAGGAFWTFEDGAPIFAPSGSCGAGKFNGRARVLPTNFGNPEEDAFPAGPVGPFQNNLASLAGGSPSGNWRLFMVDDSVGLFGFGIGGWALTLEVTPPPPPPPTVITVTVPAPAPAKTGKRAAALAKCKLKKTKPKKAACRTKARKLPV